MTLEQVILFFQEWGVLIGLLLFVLAGMATDLFPKLKSYMEEVNRLYPKAMHFIEKKQQYVINCYDRLPERIRAGFAVIGGKRAWSWLVRAGYAYVRRKMKKE